MDRDQTQRNTGTTGEWERLAPARLSPGGPGSTDVAGWFTRGALVLLALSLVWLGFSMVRPLAAPKGADTPNVRAAHPASAPAITVAERKSLLDSLTKTNWFDVDRQMWTHQDIAGVGAGESTGSAKTAKETTNVAETPTTDVETAKGLLATTAPADLPDLLAKAYADLELLGIRLRADGKLVAMISFIQSPKRGVSTSYAIGESFTDAAFSGEPWQVVFIDAKYDRVYLRRADNTVELPLWKGPSIRVASAADEAAARPTGPSRDEIIAQLRAAGVSEADIAEMLRMAEEGQNQPKAPAPPPNVKSLDETLGEIEKSSAPEEVKGVTDVLKMMGKSETRPRRSDRRRGPVPGSDTYDAPGRGHTIGSVDTNASIVTLEDGSRWEVAPAGAKRIQGWGLAPSVSVYQGRGTSRPYVLVNAITQDIVEATHIVEAPADGASGNAESADAGAGSGS